MSLEYEPKQHNSALAALKQRAAPPTLTEQQANVLYTMPVQTVEQLENVLQHTLAPPENDPGIHGHSGHEGEPGAAGHLRTAPAVAGADAGLQPGNLPVNGAHTLRHERNNQTGWEAERRIYQRALSHRVGLSEGHPGGDLFAPEMDPPFIIMSSAAAAVPVCILMWQTLT